MFTTRLIPGLWFLMYFTVSPHNLFQKELYDRDVISRRYCRNIYRFGAADSRQPSFRLLMHRQVQNVMAPAVYISLVANIFNILGKRAYSSSQRTECIDLLGNFLFIWWLGLGFKGSPIGTPHPARISGFNRVLPKPSYLRLQSFHACSDSILLQMHTVRMLGNCIAVRVSETLHSAEDCRYCRHNPHAQAEARVVRAVLRAIFPLWPRYARLPSEIESNAQAEVEHTDTKDIAICEDTLCGGFTELGGNVEMQSSFATQPPQLVGSPPRRTYSDEVTRRERLSDADYSAPIPESELSPLSPRKVRSVAVCLNNPRFDVSVQLLCASASRCEARIFLCYAFMSDDIRSARRAVQKWWNVFGLGHTGYLCSHILHFNVPIFLLHELIQEALCLVVRRGASR
jgi:hypothetical protein